MNHPNNPEVAVEAKPTPYRYEVLLTLESVKPIKDVTDLVSGRVWSVDGVIPTVTATLMGYQEPGYPSVVRREQEFPDEMAYNATLAAELAKSNRYKSPLEAMHSGGRFGGYYQFNAIPTNGKVDEEVKAILDADRSDRYAELTRHAGPLEGVLPREGATKVGGYSADQKISPEEVAAILSPGRVEVEVNTGWTVLEKALKLIQDVITMTAEPQADVSVHIYNRNGDTKADLTIRLE